ncbi:MAG: 5,10-methylenetetrahydrofolate reductase, partial [Actinomycetota bacterium]
MARIADLLAAGRTFSFEFSPPKSAAASMSLGRTIAELEPLGPSFVSVTYGAGGSTREHTRDTVLWVQRETNVPPMAHLTCVGHTRAEIEDIIATYVEAGIVNVLALAGDAPKDPADARPSDYTYATDLIEHLAVDGARAAAAYGCRGWTAHHNTDIWAQANAVKGKAVWFLWP